MEVKASDKHDNECFQSSVIIRHECRHVLRFFLCIFRWWLLFFGVNPIYSYGPLVLSCDKKVLQLSGSFTHVLTPSTSTCRTLYRWDLHQSQILATTLKTQRMPCFSCFFSPLSRSGITSVSSMIMNSMETSWWVKACSIWCFFNSCWNMQKDTLSYWRPMYFNSW